MFDEKITSNIRAMIVGYVEERFGNDELGIDYVSYESDSVTVKFNSYFFITGEPSLFGYFTDMIKEFEAELLDIVTRNTGLPHNSLIVITTSDTYVGDDKGYRGKNKVSVTWKNDCYVSLY